MYNSRGSWDLSVGKRIGHATLYTCRVASEYHCRKRCVWYRFRENGITSLGGVVICPSEGGGCMSPGQSPYWPRGCVGYTQWCMPTLGSLDFRDLPKLRVTECLLTRRYTEAYLFISRAVDLLKWRVLCSGELRLLSTN